MMNTAGVICEWNPLHRGHLYLLEQCRRHLGPEGAILCVMSGNFVQRGEMALVNKHTRAEAAVRSGADLVIELPTAWAMSPAERFARGAVELLAATGVVQYLYFGSECGELAALERVAAADRKLTPELLQPALAEGVSFASARTRALEQVLGQEALLLQSPNNTLAVEYLNALSALSVPITPVTILRRGAAHDAAEAEGDSASGSYLRSQLRQGSSVEEYLAPAMAELYRREVSAGRAPVEEQRCQRGMLSVLRRTEEEDWARLDQGNEGLYHRFAAEAAHATDIDLLLRQVKTRRYSYARLRRMLLWAYLGDSELPEHPAYLRVLAANARGRVLLREMKEKAALPILTKPADVRLLGQEAQRQFLREVRYTDLYVLAYPRLDQAEGGSEWRQNPVML